MCLNMKYGAEVQQRKSVKDSKVSIGYIVLARYNSSRLPGKFLKKIHDKPIIDHIFEKLLSVADKENIVIATSSEITDDPIFEYCKKKSYQYYRGSLNNVAERFLFCAEEYGFDYATRINGDNLFLDIETLIEMQKIALSNEFDFISNVKNRTFPKGMSIEIVKTKYYRNCFNQFETESHFEHVTPYLYEHDSDKRHYYFYNTLCPEAAGIQLAIDTQEDFVNAQNILNKLSLRSKFGLKEIFKIISENNE